MDAEKPVVEAIPPAKITGVDLRILANAADHHTDRYEITEEGYIDDITKEKSPAQLVVRRGQEFKLTLLLDRAFDSKHDKFRVISKIGKIPLRSKGTRHEMVTGEKADEGDWSAKVLSSSDKEVVLSVLSAPTGAVGKWKLEFESLTTDAEGTVTAASQLAKAELYILFNAWCKDDQVYMDNKEWREEYVLNDSGKVYVGNYRQMFGKPWNFGQFESVVLQCALWLLENKSFPLTARGNPILLSRKISALVNSSDDYGVLTGRWDGDYEGGTSPTKWVGSVAILQQYMEKKRPVEYGQCWVFSGVVTTVCRALGIPARSITNFASAHDTDGSLTIDKHWDENEKPMPELDTDSIWNFHVWNEVWMGRPDLGDKMYGGWQAIDATPQESSGGVYRAGPASVEAIKNGMVGLSYDAPFIFAEVNADQVHWIKQKDGSIRTILDRNAIGKNISTKAVGPSRSFTFRGYNPDREDVTHNYKFPEGSSAERAAVWNASRLSTKPTVYDTDGSADDVKFTTADLDDVFVGSSFTIPVDITNTSSIESRTVSLSITLSSVYYTGVTRRQLKYTSFNRIIQPGEKETLSVKVEPSDYLDDLMDHSYAMKISYLGTVHETKQCFVTQDDFRLRTIIPEVTASKSIVKKGEAFKVKVKFTNPLNRKLTKCGFSFEAAGNLKPTNIATRDVAAGGEAECECEIPAKRVGECVVITSFECKELGDLQGQCNVQVEE